MHFITTHKYIPEFPYILMELRTFTIMNTKDTEMRKNTAKDDFSANAICVIPWEPKTLFEDAFQRKVLPLHFFSITLFLPPPNVCAGLPLTEISRSPNQRNVPQIWKSWQTSAYCLKFNKTQT